ATTNAAVVPFESKPMNVLAPLKKLVKLCDQIVERENQIMNEEREWICMLDDCDRKMIEEAKELINRLDPDPAYDFDEDNDSRTLKREVVAKRLALMLDSFPGSQSANGANFTTMLLEHVCDACACEHQSVSLLALQSGCAELEANRSTVPSIKVV